jgi:LysM repeat protein
MNPDLLSANISLVFMAVLAAALLAHLSQIAGPARLLHLAHAAPAAGLLYLFGSAALGWKFIPRDVWLAIFLSLAAIVAAVAAFRHFRNGDAGFPWGTLLIQQLATAYIWAPLSFWKPPLSALLLLYFLLELYGWLKGREATPETEVDSRHPPLFPPKRVRGVREFALIGAAAAMVYVFAAGTGRAPVVSTEAEAPAQSEPATAETGAGESAETPAGEADGAAKEAAREAAAAKEPSAASSASVEKVYTALSGDTLKSIARKLYGKPEKWRDLAAANPGVKPGAKLRKGQTIKLPEPPPAR